MKGVDADIFARNVPGSTERLARAVIGIAGCGGLGSNAAVSLVRAGVGRLILADYDTIESSNLNRQHYFQKDIGKVKVEALAAQLLDINPGVSLDLHKRKLEPGLIPDVFSGADILVEAFDRAEAKRWLIESWCRFFPERPLVVASGLSGIGRCNSLRVVKSGTIYFCGDGESDSNMGLSAARVAIVANLEANVVISLLTGNEVL